jgi:DNA-binding transcriptional MerR regulator
MATNDPVESKTHYSIGDVSKICAVPSYTIRFWEKEFGNFLSPIRTRGKQRRYDDEHINQLMRIKKLLWTDRYSIMGAKRMLSAKNILTFPDTANGIPIETDQLARTIALFIQNHLTSTYTA